MDSERSLQGELVSCFEKHPKATARREPLGTWPAFQGDSIAARGDEREGGACWPKSASLRGLGAP
jgi:hypothetical protein